MKKTDKAKDKRTRINHTAEEHETARKMYLRGLYMTEIAVLLNISLRTLEKWQSAEKWTTLKECSEIKQRAYELSRAGKTRKEIAELLKISETTIWRYIKQCKNGKE